MMDPDIQIVYPLQYKSKDLYTSGTETIPCVHLKCPGIALKAGESGGLPEYTCPRCGWTMRNLADMPGGG